MLHSLQTNIVIMVSGLVTYSISSLVAIPSPFDNL